MHTTLLRDFLAGRVGSRALRRALEADAASPAAARDAGAELAFEIFPRHLVQLCDAVLAGELDPTHLEPIGLCLHESGRFAWEFPHPDGRVVEEVLTRWARRDPGRPLTRETVLEFRRWVTLRRRPADASHRL